MNETVVWNLHRNKTGDPIYMNCDCDENTGTIPDILSWRCYILTESLTET